MSEMGKIEHSTWNTQRSTGLRGVVRRMFGVEGWMLNVLVDEIGGRP